jgi:hypothetical protein
MNDELEQKQLERARRLREQIDRTVKPDSAESSESLAPKRPMSPRDFIHKRMSEIEAESDSDKDTGKQ